MFTGEEVLIRCEIVCLVFPTQQNANLDLTLSSQSKPIKVFVVNNSNSSCSTAKAAAVSSSNSSDKENNIPNTKPDQHKVNTTQGREINYPR